MKMNFKTIIAAASIVLAFSACSKDEMKEQPSESGTISVEISGNLGDLTPAGDTKAGLSSVVRLNWEDGDVAYAYDGTQCLGPLTASVDESNTSIARLSGTISAPAGNTITVVYTNISAGQPAVSSGKLSFDFSSQTLDRTPFVVYGTMDYTAGQTTISDKVIPFSFATSVIKVAATGLDESNAIDQVTIGGVNTVCELTLSNTAAPAVSGATPGGIVVGKGSKTFSLNGGRSIVSNVGVVPTAKETNKDVTFKQGSVEKYSELSASMEINASKSITTVVACITKDFVVINGLKWAKENLAITESGKREFNGTGHINGDFFQWAAYAGYCGNATDADKGLLIYESFTSKMCGDGSNAFTFKSAETNKKYSFYFLDSGKYIGISPYYNKTDYQYTAYTSGTDSKFTLESTDDVANIILGGGWRMPTGAEFQAMKDATYWSWDATDKGYYVYAPNPSTDAGKINDKGTGTYNKSNALLFFPAAGDGDNTSLNYAGSSGYYWSSNAYSALGDDACNFYFNSVNASSWNGDYRYSGFSVRPVSD